MDVFDLDHSLVSDYERFARSFTTIRARDIREQVDQIYASGRFWPEPIVSINPHFQLGDSLSSLVKEGTLHERTEKIFRIDGEPLTLFRHQRSQDPDSSEIETATELCRDYRYRLWQITMLFYSDH